MTQRLSTPTGEVTIRAAIPEDAQAVFELRLEALTAHPEAFAADVAMTRNRGAQAWEDQIRRETSNNSGTVIIATISSHLMGMTGFGRGHWPKTRHSAMVWGVYVNPAWRGLRIAGAMLNEGIGWAQLQGIVVIKLGVVATNQAAIRCYERSGFTIYGTEPKSNFLDGVYYDEFLMARMV